MANVITFSTGKEFNEILPLATLRAAGRAAAAGMGSNNPDRRRRAVSDRA